MEETDDREAFLLLDLRCERLVVPKVQGCHLVTQRELLRAPFARQEVLNRSGSLFEAQREREPLNPIARGPGSCLARIRQNRHPKRSLK